MEAVLLVIHLIVAIGIVVTILIQPSEAGGFMGTGSMSNLMVQRRGGDVLTRATTILAGIFFLTSLSLAIVAGTHPAAKGILDYDTDAKNKAAKTIIDNVPDAPIAGEKKGAVAPLKDETAPVKDETTAPVKNETAPEKKPAKKK